MPQYKKEDLEKKYRLISVEWVDAESDVEWGEAGRVADWANEDCVIHEFGWLVYEGPKYMVITNQVSNDGTIGNRTKIPKRWVRKREYIQFKKVRK